jgi:MFS family permease
MFKPHGKHIWLTCKCNLITVFKNKQTWLIGFLAGALFMPLAVFADFWAIPYFTQIFHFTNGQAVQLTALLYFGWTVGAPLVGWMSDRWARRKMPMLVSGMLCCLLFTCLLLMPQAKFSTIAILLFVLGLCSGGQVVGFITCVELNPKRANGSAIAVVNMIIMLLCGVIQTLVGHLIHYFEYQYSQWQAYQFSLFSITLSLAVSTLFFCFFSKESIPSRANSVD